MMRFVPRSSMSIEGNVLPKGALRPFKFFPGAGLHDFGAEHREMIGEGHENRDGQADLDLVSHAVVKLDDDEARSGIVDVKRGLESVRPVGREKLHDESLSLAGDKVSVAEAGMSVCTRRVHRGRSGGGRK